MGRTSDQALAGASVVITRPVGRGRALAHAVALHGGWPVLLPGVSLRAAADAERARDALCVALEGDYIVFSSPSAVRFAARLASLAGRAHVAAVGHGTGAALRRHGVQAFLVPSGAQNSDGLLAEPAMQHLGGRRVAVVGAAGGRGVLQAGLAARGAIVVDVHVYRRQSARLDRRHAMAVARLEPRAYIMLSSTQALQGIRQGLNDAAWRRLLRALVVASSRRVADAARAAGFAEVTVAASALGSDLLAGVMALHRHIE